jgi:hypothetical protein
LVDGRECVLDLVLASGVGVVTAFRFGELVGLMVWGTGRPDVFRGVIRRVQGDGEERRVRVARRGRLFREELLDGTVTEIVGEKAIWFREPEVGRMWLHRQEPRTYVDYARAPIGGLDVGGPRPSWERWTGTDFTRPTEPVTETEFLGRRAWAVELAPPSHKPHPLQLVVDAGTGLLLRETNRDFGTVEEWVELDLDPDLPDALFVWDGPADLVPSRADREAEHQAEQAERSAWLAQRGLATLRLPIECDVELHDWDEESGSLYADIYTTISATLIRRPHSDTAWSEPDSTNYEHSWRWSDGTWDWFLATETPLSEADLSTIKTRLATST